WRHDDAELVEKARPVGLDARRLGDDQNAPLEWDRSGSFGRLVKHGEPVRAIVAREGERYAVDLAPLPGRAVNEHLHIEDALHPNTLQAALRRMRPRPATPAWSSKHGALNATRPSARLLSMAS